MSWPYTIVMAAGSRVLHMVEYPAGHCDGVERSACGREGPIRTVPSDLSILGRVDVCKACCRSSPAARRLAEAVRRQQTRFVTATTRSTT